MKPNRRILVVDDLPSIHADFRKVFLRHGEDADLSMNEAILFGSGAVAPALSFDFELEFASQGQEGFEMAVRASAEMRPYALAFVDMRMPPGWDGMETVRHLWRQDPDLQVVICTAFSDVSWEDVVKGLAARDKLAILRKPFDAVQAL